MDDKYITVSQLSRYLKYKFEQDPNLNVVYLKGEVSNFKKHTRGHLYFTIKDETSRINAVMFSSNASKINFDIEDGMKVLVVGRISVYELTGSYQIYVEEMVVDGVGNLYIEFEKLKKKLASEGLFDPTHKKKIPKFPKTIGIVTAPTGAAIRDILSTIKRRWPITNTILFPSLVQGESASSDIVKQIKEAEKYDIDVLIVGRGGGSIEDLWCFNTEEVARAIYDCPIPVISAVGHEIDFTISDFVADLRAPTPTGAAEMAVPNITDFNKYINQVNIRLNQAMSNIIIEKRKSLNFLKDSYILKNPVSIYQIKEQKFDNLFDRLNLNMSNILKLSRNNINEINNKVNILVEKKLDKEKNNYLNLLNKLEILNPLLTIKRGYSITKIDNNVVSSIKDIKEKDTIDIELNDGYIKSNVISIEKK